METLGIEELTTLANNASSDAAAISNNAVGYTWLWVAIMIICLGTVIGTVIYSRKNEKG